MARRRNYDSLLNTLLLTTNCQNISHKSCKFQQNSQHRFSDTSTHHPKNSDLHLDVSSCRKHWRVNGVMSRDGSNISGLLLMETMRQQL